MLREDWRITKRFMWQKLAQITCVLAAMTFCLSCNSNFEISNSKTEPRYFGEKSKLSAEMFEKLGYQVRSFDEDFLIEWQKEEFQTEWARAYTIKNRTSLREQANTFPRYTIVEEIYENEALAAQRLKRIQEKPPDVPTEQQYYWMVTGFQYQKNVYFIQTDASVFNYYMQEFADKLAEEINE